MQGRGLAWDRRPSSEASREGMSRVGPGELGGVIEASEADPLWLRMRAAVNSLFEAET